MLRYPMGIKGCHKCVENSKCPKEKKRKGKTCGKFERVPKKETGKWDRKGYAKSTPVIQ